MRGEKAARTISGRGRLERSAYMHAYDAKHTARTCEEQAFTRYYPLKEEIPARSYFVKEFPLLRDNSISDKNLATPD